MSRQRGHEPAQRGMVAPHFEQRSPAGRCAAHRPVSETICLSPAIRSRITCSISGGMSANRRASRLLQRIISTPAAAVVRMRKLLPYTSRTAAAVTSASGTSRGGVSVSERATACRSVTINHSGVNRPERSISEVNRACTASLPATVPSRRAATEGGRRPFSGSPAGAGAVASEVLQWLIKSAFGGPFAFPPVP